MDTLIGLFGPRLLIGLAVAATAWFLGVVAAASAGRRSIWASLAFVAMRAGLVGGVVAHLSDPSTETVWHQLTGVAVSAVESLVASVVGIGVLAFVAILVFSAFAPGRTSDGTKPDDEDYAFERYAGRATAKVAREVARRADGSDRERSFVLAGWIARRLLTMFVLVALWIPFGSRAPAILRGEGGRPGSVIAKAREVIGRFNSEGRRPASDVWESVALIERAALSAAKGQTDESAASGGEIVRRVRCVEPRGASPDQKLLAELANGLVAAYDTGLQSLLERPDRYGPPTFPAYTIEIRRAWIAPEYLALIVGVTPHGVAAKAAQMKLADIWPAVDADTRLSDDDVARLHISDHRVAVDQKRGDVRGIFIALDRDVPEFEVETEAAGTNPLIVALRRGLVEKGKPASYFRVIEGPSRDYDTIAIRATTPHWTGAGVAQRNEMIEVWKGLRDAVSLYANHQPDKITMSHDATDHTFVLRVKVPPPPFPGSVPGDDRASLAKYLDDHGEELARGGQPKRYCAGLDYRGEPVYVDYEEAPHVLVAGASKSGKSKSAVIGPILQLAYTNSPNQMGLWLADPKSELGLYLKDLPHVQRHERPVAASDLVAMLNDFGDEVVRRRDKYAGREWTPRSGDPWLLLVIEEWQALVAASKMQGEDEKAIKQVAAAINRFGAMSRAAGCHVLLAAQQSTAETIPGAISANLETKMVGVITSEPALRSIFGNDVDIDRVKVPRGQRGRLAMFGSGVVDHEDEPVQVMGLWTQKASTDGGPPPDISRLIRQIREKWAHVQVPQRDEAPRDGEDLAGWALRQAPKRVADADQATPPASDDSEARCPRRPTDVELKSPTTRTLALGRAIYLWQLAHGQQPDGSNRWVPISGAGLIDYLAAEGLHVPHKQKVLADLRQMLEAGVLMEQEQGGRRYRRLAGLPWERAYVLLAEIRELRDDEAEGFAA